MRDCMEGMYRKSAVVTLLLAACIAAMRLQAALPDTITCEGDYGGHLQGVATDGESIYWSFTVAVVKTDLSGKVLVAREAPSHQGDLCFKDGKVYVAVNLGSFNTENRGRSQVTAYRADTLEPVQTWNLPDMPHGAGGMTWVGQRFYVVGGLPITHERNYVYEYTPEFRLVRRHVLETGFTWMGIQTAAHEDGRLLFGIYGSPGNPTGVLSCPEDLSSFVRHKGQGSLGIVKLDGAYYLGVTFKGEGGRRNRGKIKRADDFLAPSTLYAASRTGKGELRLFFDGRDNSGWKDSGYVMNPDGNKPIHSVGWLFVPRAKAGTAGDLPAVCIGGGRRYLPTDLVRGVRRAAERDETFSVSMPGTPESLGGDAELSAAVDGMVREAERLGVAVVGR